MKARILSAIKQGFCEEMEPAHEGDRVYHLFMDDEMYSVVLRDGKMRATQISRTNSYPTIVNELPEIPK